MSDPRLVESWTWFAVASAVVFLRYVSRSIRLGGWRFMELEDYFMLPAFGFYANLIVWVNIQEHHPITNILPPTGTAGMSHAEIQDRIYGSKVTFVIEESMVMIQFLCKLCMCLLYFKLTAGLKNQFWVKLLFTYVILGWFTTELFYFAIWCRPFLNYFRVFAENSAQCETAQHHLVMSYTFNISSDVFMLAVPLPLLIKAQLPWKRKAVLIGIFSFGIFVIISATLSRYYCFAKPDSILWIFWYVREASTAVIVANVPHLYSVIQLVFKLPAFGSLVKRSARRTNPDYPLSSVGRIQRQQSHRLAGDSESTENITLKADASLQNWQRKEYHAHAANISDGQWDDIEATSINPTSVKTKSTMMSTTTHESKESE